MNSFYERQGLTQPILAPALASPPTASFGNILLQTN